MGYKDSFVDEFPYLVYSDDPKAIGGAGGDIGIDPSTPPSQISNTIGSTVNVTVVTDPQGSRLIGDFAIASRENIMIANNVYIALDTIYALYEGAPGTDYHPATAVGTLAGETFTLNIYSVSDTGLAYEIRAAG